MKSELPRHELIQRSLIKKFRETLWNPFAYAVGHYELIRPGDRIAACISGGKDSMVMAKLLEEIQKHGRVPFELTFLVMDPGYSPANRALIEENAATLHLPIHVFTTDIFAAAEHTDRNPCYLCARMRRGALYAEARRLGCNKIALGHHFNDVVETTVMGMFYGAQLQAMLPKLRSTNFPGMELIRPLYCVHEEDIIAWARYNDLHFLRCACRLTEAIGLSPDGIGTSKRQEVKELLKTLKRNNPTIEKNIFNAIHTLSLDTMVGWKTGGEEHSFLDHYDD